MLLEASDIVCCMICNKLLTFFFHDFFMHLLFVDCLSLCSQLNRVVNEPRSVGVIGDRGSFSRESK